MNFRGLIEAASRWPGFLWAIGGMAAMQAFFALYPVYHDIGRNLLPAEVTKSSGWVGLDLPGVGVVTQDGSPRIRLTAAPGQRPAVEYPLTGWAGADAVLVEGRCRAQEVRRGEYSYQTGRILLVSIDETGRPRWDVAHVAVALRGSREWHAFRRRFVLSPEAASLRLMVHHGGVGGTIETDGLSVRPQRVNPSAGWVFTGWGGIWGIALFITATRLRLARRRGGGAVMAVAAAIVVGMLVPERAISAVQSVLRLPPSLPLGRAAAPPSTAVPPAVATAGSDRPTAAVRPPKLAAWHRWAAAVDVHRAGHLMLFVFLAAAAARCFGIRLTAASAGGRGLWKPVGGLALFALAAEQLQWLTWSRSPKLEDASINLVGLALGLLLAEACFRHRAEARPLRAPTPPR